MPKFSSTLTNFLTKQAGIGMLAEDAVRGVGQALGKGKASGKAIEYTIKPAHDAGKFMKAFHYGATPAFLSANAVSDYKGIQRAKKFDPQENSPVPLNESQIKNIKKKVVNKARGRALGDAASWAAFPLSFRSTPLNLAVGLGTGIGLPAVGEAIGGKL